MPLSPPPQTDFAKDGDERFHPVLTLLLVLAASGLGWALIFAALFLRTL